MESSYELAVDGREEPEYDDNDRCSECGFPLGSDDYDWEVCNDCAAYEDEKYPRYDD